ncbi:hexamerin-1.1-like [Condylostylus longicornis]|uniref:hexamerin-1.1-like n=1 Tax=Condylostylus longicornis TaxID=2530218 RepID=UPI00244DE438|nr:hexamerin-1.1-like [Condylostylus longicornis]
MRAITVAVLLGLALCATAYVTPGDKVKIADHDFLVKQKVIFEILRYVDQYDYNSQYYKDAMAYKIEDHYDKYTNVDAVKEFVKYYKYGLMEKDEIFSIMYDEHRDWAVSLFHVFYYAKDWETFYNTMVWAKYHINQGLFVYSLSVAVLHRDDMHGMELPAPYEIYPYYFFNSEVIEKARTYRLNNFYGLKQVENKYEVIIPMNYTGRYMYYSDEQSVSYFTEDIGLNTYYYYFHTDYPFWMEGEEFGLNKDRRGELYLFEHQQILARYYMERISNHLGRIPEFSWYLPVKTGYYSNLRYYNGLFFPTREDNFNFYMPYNYYDIMKVQDIERRIRDAIDYGYIYLPSGEKIDLSKPESIEYLGNIMQGNPDFEHWEFHRYLTVFARLILGSTWEGKHNVKYVPSVLEQFETSMRDPLFYMLYKRLINYYWQFKDHLPYYTREELYYEGVKIESVEIDKLVTYFDKFDSDISSVAKFGYTTGEDITHDDFVIYARQWRLNHLPFTVKMNVDSKVSGKAVVRMYLGPKYNEMGHTFDMDEMRENFWFMESFTYDLVPGKNSIVRHSQDFTYFVKDRTTSYELYQWVMRAYDGKDKFPLDMTEAHCGFPQRLMLPKGWKSGMPVQFYFIISPYHAPEHEQYSTFDEYITCGVGSGSRYLDTLPLGYPFDRPIEETEWYTPNMYYYDTFIFHKKEVDPEYYNYYKSL